MVATERVASAYCDPRPRGRRPHQETLINSQSWPHVRVGSAAAFIFSGVVFTKPQSFEKGTSLHFLSLALTNLQAVAQAELQFSALRNRIDLRHCDKAETRI